MRQVTFIVALVVVVACAAVATPTPTPPPVEVTIDDYTFKPDAIEVGVGGSVRWVNRDQFITHTVTNSPTAEVPLKPDKTYDLEVAKFNVSLDGGQATVVHFAAPGTYFYYCLPHNWMRGKVFVR